MTDLEEDFQKITQDEINRVFEKINKYNQLRQKEIVEKKIVEKVYEYVYYYYIKLSQDKIDAKKYKMYLKTAGLSIENLFDNYDIESINKMRAVEVLEHIFGKEKVQNKLSSIEEEIKTLNAETLLDNPDGGSKYREKKKVEEKKNVKRKNKSVKRKKKSVKRKKKSVKK